jgi:hypothetical protein
MGRHLLLVKGVPMKTMPLYSRAGSDPDRGENIVDVLLGGESVALVGAAGTGKFTELNALLLPLFQSLADQQSPLRDVFQRVGRCLYRFRTNDDGMITCCEIKSVGNEIQDLNTYFRSYKNRKDIERGITPRNDAVLLLAMSESEIDVDGDPESRGRGWYPPVDPRFTHIPTAVALSARLFRDALKTFVSAGVVRFAARPTHTGAELAVLVSALYHGGESAAFYGEGDRAELCEVLGLPVGASLQDVLTATQRRVEMVGPIARMVLGSNY